MSRLYTLADLCREADIGRRTLASYIRRGVLPRVKPRGPLPAYDEAFLTHLKAAIRLRNEGVSIGETALRLRDMSPAEIAHLAGVGPPPPPKEVVVKEVITAAAQAPAATERWERTRLYPGLELHLAADADEAAQRMARVIRTMFGPQGGG